MQLTDKDIENFQALYKKHFNKEISRQEALDKGTKLLTLMKAVYRPMTQEQFDAIQKRRKDTLPALIKRLEQD
jgi:urease accessory protein UreF